MSREGYPNLEEVEIPDFQETNNTVPDLDDLELEYDQYKNNENNDTFNDKDLESNSVAKHNAVNSSKGVKGSKIDYFNPSDVSLYDNSVSQFEETTVSLKEYYDHSIRSHLTVKGARSYLKSVFPIINWLPHYNFSWFTADLIAGITIGCVLVPQSMSYAQVATLPAQYGLYSSFIGAYSYSFFATSKDVCIGPVAVMSLQTAKVIADVTAKYPDGDSAITGPVIATTLALLCGIISAAVGFLRLGFLVELISLNAVAGFMTGSAFNILWGQVPALMGYNSLVNTRAATYKVVIETLKHLPDTKLDAVFGLIPLFLLYVWKWWCGTYGPRLNDKYNSKNPRLHKIIKWTYFYAQASRNGIIIIVFTCIGWAITRGKSKSERPISILGSVPSGLKEVGVFHVPPGLMSKLGPNLPASIIVLLLEHIAISKSFGRINDYKVVPDQELIAIGVSNLLGTFFNAYPATGSFSRSALKAKCNVRTPLSGLFSGSCVLLALYCLTGAFFYIPKATLSAVIIHAVSDLLASYQTTWNFWKMNPLDFICFIVTVLITVFASIEDGIYFAMCWSCAMLILKVAFPAGKFLGRVEVAEVTDAYVRPDSDVVSYVSENNNGISTLEDGGEDDKESSTKYVTNSSKKIETNVQTKGFDSPSSSISQPRIKYHTKWIPFDHKYTRELNPDVQILPPPDGVLVYRLSESYTYLNCSRHYNIITEEVKKVTRRGQLIRHRKKSDRPWNDPGPWEAPAFLKNLKFWKKRENDPESMENAPSTSVDVERDDRPLLKILCLDFSQVAQTDATALQSLVDLRKAINQYADRQVEFHFVGIISPWVKRGLISRGFGTLNEEYSDESIVAGHTSYHVARVPQGEENPEKYSVYTASGTNLPFFHIDIPDFAKWDI
ncbi:CDN_1a_G0035660.mRNA.1.CDS.1 [Saccharomyces cerevisiae]|nr:CDN_1a_G0035660.mRNA.1.CDS.1 [Saccharomyces cerevisiae]CAI7404876.1 CDN_1a_G0035660.mRNA.1.CDS.1 [Saccharomyces cerevisiae]